MGKKTQIKEQRKRQKRLEQTLIFGGIFLAALAIVFIVIWPNLKAEREIVVPDYVNYPVQNVPEGETGMGNVNAPVKLQVFADFQCPACANFALNIEPKIVSEYVKTGKVYLTFHPFSFLDQGNIGQESHKAAEAAYCALDQNAFWQYHDILFNNLTGENVGDYTKARLTLYAEKIGLDMNAFNECFEREVYAQRVLDDVDIAQTLGVDRTPSFFVNGTRLIISSSYDELFQSIDSALK